VSLITPFWFKQRQSKAEPAGADAYRLTGPNLREGTISIRRADNGKWLAALRLTPGGPEIETTPPEYETTYEAWEAAFELFRRHCVV
jgi:hypothetical protein